MPGGARRRAPSSAMVKPAPVANPSSAQSTAARRLIRPGATTARSSSDSSLPGSSTKAASAMRAPSSVVDNPIDSPIARVAWAISSDQGTLMPISSNSGRRPTVRVRASSPTTSRQPVMNSAGTNPIARRGTTTSAITPSTSATVDTTR